MCRTRQVCRAAFCAALAVVIWPGASPRGGRALAAPVAGEPEAPPPMPGAGAPIIAANGICPSAERTWTAMTLLVPKDALDQLPRTAEVEVTDLGETYRVRLVSGGVERVRVYRDLARDCEQRARFAAVFVVLTLMPPELLIESPRLPPPAELPPPAATPQPPPPPPEPPPRRLLLEAGALLDAAPALGSAPRMIAVGGELRAIVGGMGGAGLAAVVGVGLQPRIGFTVGALRGHQRRLPLDAGVRVRRPVGPIELAGELGLAAAVFSAEGESPAIPKQAVRLDLGLRGGLVLRLARPRARIAPVLSLHGMFFPRTYELATTPQGVLGHTPAVWLGATAGVSASF
jgi:hypothetical protein